MEPGRLSHQTSSSGRTSSRPSPASGRTTKAAPATSGPAPSEALAPCAWAGLDTRPPLWRTPGQALVDLLDHRRALSHGRGDSLDRAPADVAYREDAGEACLKPSGGRSSGHVAAASATSAPVAT